MQQVVQIEIILEYFMLIQEKAVNIPKIRPMASGIVSPMGNLSIEGGWSLQQQMGNMSHTKVNHYSHFIALQKKCYEKSVQSRAGLTEACLEHVNLRCPNMVSSIKCQFHSRSILNKDIFWRQLKHFMLLKELFRFPMPTWMWFRLYCPANTCD